jgi:tRNA-splicing ligase RtcB
VSTHRATIFKNIKTVNTKDLVQLGVLLGDPIRLAHEFIQNFIAQGSDGALLEAEIFNVVANPPAFFADELRASLVRAIYRPAFTLRTELAPGRQWGERLEAAAGKQMANASALLVAVAGALMPNALVGYGLPIGAVALEGLTSPASARSRSAGSIC